MGEHSSEQRSSEERRWICRQTLRHLDELSAELLTLVIRGRARHGRGLRRLHTDWIEPKLRALGWLADAEGIVHAVEYVTCLCIDRGTNDDRVCVEHVVNCLLEVLCTLRRCVAVNDGVFVGGERLTFVSIRKLGRGKPLSIYCCLGPAGLIRCQNLARNGLLEFFEERE